MNSFKAPLTRGSFNTRAQQFLRLAACWALAAQLTGLPVALAAGDTSSAAAVDKPAPKAATDPNSC